MENLFVNLNEWETCLLPSWMEKNIHLNLLFNDRHVFVFPSWKEKKTVCLSEGEICLRGWKEFLSWGMRDVSSSFVDGNILCLNQWERKTLPSWMVKFVCLNEWETCLYSWMRNLICQWTRDVSSWMNEKSISVSDECMQDMSSSSLEDEKCVTGFLRWTRVLLFAVPYNDFQPFF